VPLYFPFGGTSFSASFLVFPALLCLMKTEDLFEAMQMIFMTTILNGPGNVDGNFPSFPLSFFFCSYDAYVHSNDLSFSLSIVGSFFDVASSVGDNPVFPAHCESPQPLAVWYFLLSHFNPPRDPILLVPLVHVSSPSASFSSLLIATDEIYVLPVF